jgi:hypothetical protein
MAPTKDPSLVRKKQKLMSDILFGARVGSRFVVESISR